MKKFPLLLCVASLLVTMFTLNAGSTAAGAFPNSTVTITGHGFGHGRGMGQYGALGYAVNSGWSYQQILDHYYGGTSPGAPAPNATIGVRMNELDGNDTIVMSQSAFTVGSVPVAPNSAALVHRSANNTFTIQTSSSCSGPWVNAATGVAGPVLFTPSNPGNALNQVLQLCESVGTRGVAGTVQAIDDNGTQRTINSLPVEDYLKGVVPRESPASWGDLGNGAGMNALESQAVAARSYVLAHSNYSYATTCDTTACQVYGGIWLNGTNIQDARSTSAVNNTAGVVRRFPDGSVALTEFSSSTGGYTAGGAFPAVVDDGDAYSGNANHNWTVNVNVSTIENAYPAIGSLQSIVATSRNGLGDYGGRVNTLSIIGSNGAVTTTGADFEAKVGLKSTWFQIQGTPSGGVGGYWEIGNDGGVFSFGDAQFLGSMGGQHLNQPIISMAANIDSHGYWEIASDGGVFSYGSSQFFGSMGGQPLNKPIVGMTPTPDGKGYWEVASDGGIFAFGDAQFFGSMGGQPLNKPIVGMRSTPSGHGYWLVASDGGIFAYGDAGFMGSTGSITLRQPIVGMSSTSDGAGYWLVAADGGVFAYGDAPFEGSLPGAGINATITSMASTFTGQGYDMVANNGNVYAFGDAPHFGDLSTYAPNFRGTVYAIVPSA
jgi:SpoIID/LytB domain protein